MSKLAERMTKKNAPKTWIAEVRRMEREKELAEAKADEYLNIISNLARQLRREQEEFNEWLMTTLGKGELE